MIIKALIIIICVIAVVMTFRGEWILKTFARDENPSDKKVLLLKYVALCLAAIAFVIIFLTR